MRAAWALSNQTAELAFLADSSTAQAEAALVLCPVAEQAVEVYSEKGICVNSWQKGRADSLAEIVCICTLLSEAIAEAIFRSNKTYVSHVAAACLLARNIYE